MVASVPHRRLGPSGMIVPSWARSRRRPRTRWGANSPLIRIRRNTRLPPTPMPCSRRSRALTLRYPSPANGESVITCGSCHQLVVGDVGDGAGPAAQGIATETTVIHRRTGRSQHFTHPGQRERPFGGYLGRLGGGI